MRSPARRVRGVLQERRQPCPMKARGRSSVAPPLPEDCRTQTTASQKFSTLRPLSATPTWAQELLAAPRTRPSASRRCAHQNRISLEVHFSIGQCYNLDAMMSAPLPRVMLMPVDARCKLVYLSGVAKKNEQSMPRGVFQHLWPDDAAPSNPTQLARALGVGQSSSLRSWYTKMPPGRQEQIAVRYGFTPDLRRSWEEESCHRFKDRFEQHWNPILMELQRTGGTATSDSTTTSRAIATLADTTASSTTNASPTAANN
jgi:hypothetical protein